MQEAMQVEFVESSLDATVRPVPVELAEPVDVRQTNDP